jgi:hypothetical protein
MYTVVKRSVDQPYNRNSNRCIMSLVRRRIDVTIALGKGQLGDIPGEPITLTGHRVIAQMECTGGECMGKMQISIYGPPLSMINKLTCIGANMTEIRGQNRLQVAAGDDGGPMSLIFDGTIDQAWADFNAAPDVSLNVVGYSGLDAALKPIGPSSYKGATDAALIMANLAKTMGLAFENTGVSVMMSNPSLPGTALTQVKSCATAARINYTIDRGVLAIWPTNGARAGDIPLISPETRLVGYPTYSSHGVIVKSMFMPSAKLGGRVQIESSLTPARGTWNTIMVTHTLESERPGGAWFTDLHCGRFPT